MNSKKLTTFEKACHFGAPGGFYFVNTLVTKLEEGTAKIEKSHLNEAVTHWIKHNPILNASVQKIDGEDHWVKIDKELTFENITLVDTDEIDEWKNILNAELLKEFDQPEKCWTMKCIRHTKSNQYVFLFTTLHSLFDSTSSNRNAVEFFNILGAILEGKECEEMNTVLSFPYNMEEILAKQTFRDDFKTKVAKCEVVGNEYPKNFGLEDAKPGDITVDFFSIEKEKANKLVKAAKKYTSGGAKMNSVFINIINMAIKRLYALKEVNKNMLLSETAINTRKQFGLEDNALACYVTCLFETFDLNELTMDTFWTMSEKKSKHLHSLINDMQEIDKMYKDVVASLDTGDDGSYEQMVNFCTSNLGIMRNSIGCIKVTNEYLVAKVPHNYGMYFSIVTIDGNQHWTMVHYKNFMSSETIKEFQKEFNNVIEELTKDI